MSRGLLFTLLLFPAVALGAEEREKLERDLREAARLEDSTDAGLARVLDSAGASERPSAPQDPAEAKPEPEESGRDGSRHAS